jgi:hypothetical protein
LSEKSARKRTGRGVVSVVRDWRRVLMVASVVVPSSAAAEGVVVVGAVIVGGRWLGMVCVDVGLELAVWC